MEKDRTYRTVSVIALIVAVVALSIGYAAFTASLNITATAKVEPTNTFTDNIKFNEDAAVGDNSTDGLNIEPGDASGDVWENIEASLTKPGDKAEVTATILNDSDFTAYLYQLTESEGTFKVEVDLGNTDWYDVENQEKGTDLTADQLKQLIKCTVKIDDTTVYDSSTDSSTYTANSLSIEAGDSATATVTFEYVDPSTLTDVPGLDVPLKITIPTLTTEWSTYSQYPYTSD